MCLQNFRNFFAFACKSEEPFFAFENYSGGDCLKFTQVGTIENFGWGPFENYSGGDLIFFFILFLGGSTWWLSKVYNKEKKRENGSFNVIKRMEIRIPL